MVVKSVSLVELKKQQWAREKGNIYIYCYLHEYIYIILFKTCFIFTTTAFRRDYKT